MLNSRSALIALEFQTPRKCPAAGTLRSLFARATEQQADAVVTGSMAAKGDAAGWCFDVEAKFERDGIMSSNTLK